MDSASHIALFQKIAKPYGLLFWPIANAYSKLVQSHLHKLTLPDNAHVLDVGCGTGAFGYAFKTHGIDVQGVDGARSMAAIAESHGVPCTISDGAQGLPFSDNAFDLVTAAFVIHGLVRPDRMALLSEMARVSRSAVLIHDYSPASLGAGLSYVRFFEWLERSDFKEFRKNGMNEMNAIFKHVNIIHRHPRFCWYYCT